MYRRGRGGDRIYEGQYGGVIDGSNEKFPWARLWCEEID